MGVLKKEIGVLIIFVCFPFLLYSQVRPHIYLSPSTTEISPGDSVDLEIGLSEGDSVKSVLLFLDYDEDLYLFRKGTLGKLFQGATFHDIHLDTLDDNSIIYLSGVVLGAGVSVSAPGAFFTLRFVALKEGDALFSVDSLIFYSVNLDTMGGSADELLTHITPDTFPPDPISDFKVQSGSGELLFSWRNPNDADFQGVMIIRNESSFYDSIPENPVVIYDGAGTSCKDSLLSNNTAYYYSAFAYDEVPNYSVPAFLTGEPKEELVFAYPNPFNPDEQSVLIKAVLPGNAFINISIYDAIGNLVINLVENQPVTGGEPAVFSWDGTNSSGEIVANGVYYYLLKSDQAPDKIYKLAVLR